ncbi:ABC-type branched-subunit amino acid transport system ATPase component [Peribacillus frigoritolerans]|nr:ABC-type branched-subunit amino acid transport system ATPase component [Peribacillus frigoritolerans]
MISEYSPYGKSTNELREIHGIQGLEHGNKRMPGHYTIGPNGYGKSALLKPIGRILKQKSGSVFLQGQDLHRIHTKQIAKLLALLHQNPVSPAQLKVEELVSYGRYPHRNNVNRLTKKIKKRLNGPWISQKPFHFGTGKSPIYPVVKVKRFGWQWL